MVRQVKDSRIMNTPTRFALLFVFALCGCETRTDCGGPDSTKTPSQPVNSTLASAESEPLSPTFAADTEAAYALPRKQSKIGWIKLFDGRTTFGWSANSDANWHVADGVLTADTGKEGLLVTDVPFADFELKCEYRLAKGGNSGVFLRTAFKPTNPAVDCYELNICDTHKAFATGSLVARKPADVKVHNEGNWQSYHVVVKGNHFTVTLDGKKVLDFSDTSKHVLLSGYIGLQFREKTIEFRKVLLKPLGGKPIFNGKDLSGWKVIPGAKGTAKIEDAAIRLKNNVFLQSDAAWGDFVLRADVRTNAKNVNSGIFFRSMDGTAKQPANGYELQVHNGFAGGDRTKPNDYKTGYGTGAIFRFQKARRVIPDDKEWCTLTLVAHGDRFASWVNGYQVTSWRDQRKPNKNPRRGRRLKAGHFILQGHDVTSDVSFRHLKVAKYPSQ
jgi:3-keto-disaccharide hydrolase